MATPKTTKAELERRGLVFPDANKDLVKAWPAGIENNARYTFDAIAEVESTVDTRLDKSDKAVAARLTQSDEIVAKYARTFTASPTEPGDVWDGSVWIKLPPSGGTAASLSVRQDGAWLPVQVASATRLVPSSANWTFDGPGVLYTPLIGGGYWAQLSGYLSRSGNRLDEARKNVIVAEKLVPADFAGRGRGTVIIQGVTYAASLEANGDVVVYFASTMAIEVGTGVPINISWTSNSAPAA